jgi:hypothetical protein
MKPSGMIGSNLLTNASTRSTRWHANHINRIEKSPQMFDGRRRSRILKELNKLCHT